MNELKIRNELRKKVKEYDKLTLSLLIDSLYLDICKLPEESYSKEFNDNNETLNNLVHRANCMKIKIADIYNNKKTYIELLDENKLGNDYILEEKDE